MRVVSPTLLSLSDVGIITAATLLIAAGNHTEKLTTRAAFAIRLQTTIERGSSLKAEVRPANKHIPFLNHGQRLEDGFGSSLVESDRRFFQQSGSGLAVHSAPFSESKRLRFAD